MNVLPSGQLARAGISKLMIQPGKCKRVRTEQDLHAKG